MVTWQMDRDEAPPVVFDGVGEVDPDAWGRERSGASGAAALHIWGIALLAGLAVGFWLGRWLAPLVAGWIA